MSLAKAGAEHGDVHVFDVATGKDGKDAVPQADGAGSGDCLAWNHDGTGFYYTRGRPDGASPNAFRHVNFHKLGDAAEKDVAVLGQDGLRIAQWEVTTGEDGRTDRRADGGRRQRTLGALGARAVGTLGQGRDEGRRRAASRRGP